MASDGQTVKYARRAATGQGCEVVLPIICMALTKLVRLRLLDVEADICASLSDIQSHILARGMSGRVKPGWRRSEFSASKRSEEGEHHCRLEHALVLLVTPLVQAELVEELPQQINCDWEASALDCRSVAVLLMPRITRGGSNAFIVGSRNPASRCMLRTAAM